MTYSKATTCVHEGTQRDSEFHGINSPIHTSSAFGYIESKGKFYPRYFNIPNQENINRKLAALEGGEAGLFLSSGMAAISTAIFGLMKQGEHAIFQNDIYGGTHHLISSEMEKFGLSCSMVNSLNVEDFAKAIKPNTRLIYIETPSNPLLKIIDIKAIADLAKSHDILTLIDNTFASPINQNPITLGIDVVLHSGTKYIGGHSDLCCGAIATSQELMDKMRQSAMNFGGSLNAQTCYMIERSMKTLALRVNQQNENAMKLAEFLNAHPKVAGVHYPGLSSHPGHEVASAQMSGFGGMLSFELKMKDPSSFLSKLNIVYPAMSLGGVETTVCSPAQTSHAKISAEERAKVGISDGLLRVSVGIEEANDLLYDFGQAMNGE